MKKLNFFVGRLQPVTQGHINCINEGEAPCIVYRISSDKEIEQKKNGIKIGSKSFTKDTVKKVISYIDNQEGDLTEQEKELLKRPFTNKLIEKELEIIRKSNKNIIDVVPVINMYDALDRFNAFITEHQDEYEPQYWMCGDDRVESYSKTIDQYDELETELKSSKKIPNIVKGVLKTNTGKGRTEGVSGTAVRKSILNKDKAAFEKIMPKGVGTMFDDFIKAFEDFKNQLKGFVKECKMISLRDFIVNEAILKIKAKQTIQKDGEKYFLVVSQNYNALGKKAKGYLAQYVSNDNETLIGFTADHINKLEEKIAKYCRENNIK